MGAGQEPEGKAADRDAAGGLRAANVRAGDNRRDLVGWCVYVHVFCGAGAGNAVLRRLPAAFGVAEEQGRCGALAGGYGFFRVCGADWIESGGAEHFLWR